MTLTKKDTEKIKEIVIDGVNEGIEQLILPQLDEVYKRLDGVEGRFDGVEGRFDGVEKQLDGLEIGQSQILRKLTHSEDRLDDHAVTLEDHEKRITQLELQPSS